MDERSPLDNRSLSHTSREPEGQAWAQIGTKAPAKTVSLTVPTASSGSQSAQTLAKPAGTGEKQPTAVAASPPPPSSVEEDAMSDDGRPLQVVEDAEPDQLPENNGSTVPTTAAVGGGGGETEVEEEEKETSSGEDPQSATAVTEGGATAGDKPGSGREGGRGRGDASDRTNSMDPKLIRARVFVGHLNTDKCSRAELEELFSPFGKVASCSLQHGYGFVQYYEEQAAKRAITELHGLQFKGMKLGIPPYIVYIVHGLVV